MNISNEELLCDMINLEKIIAKYKDLEFIGKLPNFLELKRKCEIQNKHNTNNCDRWWNKINENIRDSFEFT